MTNNEPSSRPFDVAAVISHAGVHVIDAISIAPGVVRVTVTPGRARIAAAYLLQAGYDAARTTDSTVTAALPEPTE
jgi:hypothetical protein